MRPTTNFVHPVGAAAPVLAAGLWGIALISLAAAVWLTIDTFAMRRDLPDLKERLAEVENRAQEADTQDVPPVAELASLKERVSLVNGLVGGQGRPLSALLTRLEALIPDETYLVSLHYRQRTGEAQLVAEAQRAEALSMLLLKLEQSGYFAEVLLTRQSLRTARGRKHVQFELRLKEKS
jgi:Tfp pilus assembly protein PilN